LPEVPQTDFDNSIPEQNEESKIMKKRSILKAKENPTVDPEKPEI